MIYLVGLGNPGAQYANTRHNIGWLALDAVAKTEVGSETERVAHWSANIQRLNIKDVPVILVYPETYMNRSGETVRAILKDDPDAEIVLVHDDVALPLGQLRIACGRGDGGHNGVRSVYAQTKRKDFVRLRIGVAPVNPVTGRHKVVDGAALRRHVLGSFAFWERTRVTAACQNAVAALSTVVSKGPETAMNQHN